MNVWDFRDWIRETSGGVELQEMEEAKAISDANALTARRETLPPMLCSILCVVCSGIHRGVMDDCESAK